MEGNWWIVILKYLFNEFKKGNDVGKLIEKSFCSVEVVFNLDEDLVAYLVIMGFKYINGNCKWKVVN